MQEFSQNDQKGGRAFDLSSAPKCSPLNFDLNGNSQTHGWIYHMLVRALRIGVFAEINILPKLYQANKQPIFVQLMVDRPQNSCFVTTWQPLGEIVNRNCNFVMSAHYASTQASQCTLNGMWGLKAAKWTLVRFN